MIKLKKGNMVVEVYTKVQASAFTKVGYEEVKEEAPKPQGRKPKTAELQKE